MRIVYIGCVESSRVFLHTLLKAGAEIVGVVTKSASKFNADFCDITPLCREYGVPYYCTEAPNDDQTFQFIMDCRPDMVYCFGWSHLISERIIEAIPHGIVGFHPAALPHNRGRHPIVWALALGLESTASSFFMIEKEADTGAIVSQCPIPISYSDTAATLINKILACGVEQVVELWSAFERGTVRFRPQNRQEGNAWRKRGRHDGEIDWRMSSRSIYNLVRALTKPYVGAHFVYGEKDVKVWSVEEVIDPSYANIEPGKVIEAGNNGSILVKTGENLVRLLDFDPVELHTGDYL